MADEARGTIVVDADTDKAEQKVRGLADILGGFFSRTKSGSDDASGSVSGLGSSFSQLAGGVAVGNLAAKAATESFELLVSGIRNAVVGVTHIVTGFAEAGDAIFTLSRKTGISAESLSAFKYVADQTGTSVEAIAGNVFKAQINIEKGGKNVAAALHAIGLSSKELKDAKPEEQFAKILDGLGKIDDAGQRALIGTQIFGKGFKEVAQLVDEDMDKLIENAKTFGLVMSDEMAAAGDQFGDTISDIKSMFTGVRNIIGAEVLPVVNAFMGTLRDELVVAFKLVKDAIAPVFAGLGAFKKGLVETAQSADFHTKVLQVLLKTLAFLIDTFGYLVTAIERVLQVYYAFQAGIHTIAIAIDKVVITILSGIQSVYEALSKLPGVGDAYAKSAQNVGAIVGWFKRDLADAQSALDGYQKKFISVTDASDAFSGKLHTVADNLRKSADAYQGTATAAEEAKAPIKGLSDEFGELDLSAKKSTDKLDEFNKKLVELGTDLARPGVAKLSDVDFLKIFGKSLDDAEEELKKFGYIGTTVPDDVWAAFDRLNKLRVAEGLKKDFQEIQATIAKGVPEIKGLGDTIIEQGERVDKATAESLKNQVKAREETAKQDRENEYKSAEYAIEQAKRRGAKASEIAQMERAISARRRDDAIADAQKEFNERTKAIDRTTEYGQAEYDEYAKALEAKVAGITADWELNEEKKRVASKSTFDEIESGLSQMVDDFAKLSQIVPGLGGLFQSIGQIAGAIKIATDAGHQFEKAQEFLRRDSDGNRNIVGGITSIVTGITGAVAAMDAATSSGNRLKNALGGALTGAKLGSQIGGLFGPMGQAIGAGVGAAAGAIIGVFRGKQTWQKIQDEVLRDYRVSISEPLAKAIEVDAKNIGDRSAAIALHLADILKEAGGITADNADLWVQKTRDLFSFLERGQLSAKQVAEELDQIFPQLAESIDKTTGLASEGIRELIALDDRFATHSAEIAKFVSGQLKGALSGLNEFLSNAQVSSQAAAEAIGTGLAGAFNQMRAQGTPIAQILKDIGPQIEAFKKQLEETGFTGGAAFDEIAKLAATASDAIVSKALSAVSGLTEFTKGLYNANVLTADQFVALSSQIGATYDKLKAEGKAGPEVIALMAPQLQTIWELEQRYGVALDASTQALLDQAEAQGVVGAAHKSASDQMLDASNRMVQVLEAIATKMGVDLPAAASAFGNAVTKNADVASDAIEQTGEVTSDMMEELKKKTPYWNDWSWYAEQSGGIVIKAVEGAGDAVDEFGDQVSDPQPWQALNRQTQDAWTSVRNKIRDDGIVPFTDFSYKLRDPGPFVQLKSNALNALTPVDGMFKNLKGDIGGIDAVLGDAADAFSDWRDDAVGAVNDVRDAVDGVSFGSSPGGIKEYRIQLRDAMSAFRNWRDVGTDAARSVRAAVDAVNVPMIGSPESGMLAASGGVSAPISLHVSNEFPITVHIPETTDPMRVIELADEIVGPRILDNMRTGTADMHTKIAAVITTVMQNQGKQ